MEDNKNPKDPQYSNPHNSNENNVESPSEKFDALKKAMLNELLLHPITVRNEINNTNKMMKIGDFISEEDIWFSKDKPKPFIKDNGFDKLVRVTGAIFDDVIFIEKQSDFANVNNGQVLAKIKVSFPNGETNTEIATANALNCKDDISRSNMPIMAEKRAKARAFYRSNFINLTAFGDSEMSDELSRMFREVEKENESLKKSNKELNYKYENMAKEWKEFYRIVVENTPYIDRMGNKTMIMQITDPFKLEGFLDIIKNEKDPQYQLNPLQEQLFKKRLKILKKEKENDDYAKMKTEEILKAKAESKKEDSVKNFYH